MSEVILTKSKEFQSTTHSESVPVDPEREEELPSGEVPQLAARAQRRPDHVHRAQDRKDGPLHERLGGEKKRDIEA